MASIPTDNAHAGRVALVTGAGRGIGRAIALELAGQGAVVLVNYNGSRECAQEVVREIEENGGRSESFGCDVSDFHACGKMIEEIMKKYLHVDILVNNAGMTYKCLAQDFPSQMYQKIQKLNLETMFELCQICYPYIIEAILSISSAQSTDFRVNLIRRPFPPA